MILFSMPVFLLMLGAAILGFLIAWTWIRTKIDQMQGNMMNQQEQFLSLQQNYQDLLDHSNARQGEKEKLIQKIDNQQLQLAQLKVIHKQLKEDKVFISQELEDLQKKKSKGLALPRQITGELASLKSQIDELTQEKENWREKYMIIRDANDEHIAKLSAIGKDSGIEEELEEPNINTSKIDWREEFHQMQLQLNQKLQEYQDANKKLRREYTEMKEHYLEETKEQKNNIEKGGNAIESLEKKKK